MRTDSIIKALKVGKGENSYEMFLINNDKSLSFFPLFKTSNTEKSETKGVNRIILMIWR